MNDERMQPLLDTWYRDREVAPRDVHEGVAQVMANVPRTRQQGRWWPLPSFDRPVSTLPSQELAPAPIPATNGPKSAKGFTMFSAAKFVFAAAIVALFGGFLLTGVLTTPQGDETAPAAVTESPSPMTTEELLSGMVTEEVEPGVLRVVDDGVRDLTSVDNRDVVAGYDGGIWLLREEEFLRLRSDGSHEWPAGVRSGSHVFEVAPDGTMWVIPLWKMRLPDVREGSGLRSNDGEKWTGQTCPGRCHGTTVAPDGTVWASWFEGDRAHIGHLGPSGWQPLDGYVPFDRQNTRLLLSDAGDLYESRCGWACDLYRYGGGAWQHESAYGELVDVAPDGTVWLGVGTQAHSGETPPLGQEGLARFAGGEWAEWTSVDLPDISLGFGRDHEFKAAPDGSLWFSLWRSADGRDPREDDFDGDITTPVRTGYLACDGLARFDGQTLDRFLPGQCISMDIAADGSVWVLADDGRAYVFDDDETEVTAFDDDHTWDLYVITPEAVAATE